MKKTICSIVLLLMFHIASAQNNTVTAKPFILGNIETIKSVTLSENRTLNIYLPEGYNPKDSTKYPVVYLLDGSADEDFIQVVGLYHYNNFPWINRVPKSIIVGIANVDRKRDFTYPTNIKSDQKTYTTSGHSDKFIAFIEKELQPYIEKRYHTNSSRTIIGQSLGGLVATEILLKKPKLFNSYIIISPSLWWDNGSLFGLNGDILDKSFTDETKIYIGVGKEGLAPSEAPHVMEVDANLLAEKIKGTKSENLKVYFDYLPSEDHATVTHQAVFNALRLLNPKPTNIK
ncbi:esterase [Pedobacter antarcticus 4BY]|uniref:Esterase n=2 Tax=Pedobacter antarcticus TaxID=34086 RepID=A0A081PHW1_9SPHI|nr:alpha/beta hydrolase-fold protein [Pedobacter antarcticus]KEQ30284.1 esterase [Pedobacter antarcticus 4BY]